MWHWKRMEKLLMRFGSGCAVTVKGPVQWNKAVCVLLSDVFWKYWKLKHLFCLETPMLFFITNPGLPLLMPGLPWVPIMLLDPESRYFIPFHNQHNWYRIQMHANDKYELNWINFSTDTIVKPTEWLNN